MYAKHTTQTQLQQAADNAGLEVTIDERGDRLMFTIKRHADDTTMRYAKYNPRPSYVEWVGLEPIVGEWKMRRAGRSVCFHGHYRFFWELFELNYEAVVESNRYGHIVYTADTLVEQAAQLGQQRLGPVGNIYHGFQQRECCYCNDSMLDENESPY